MDPPWARSRRSSVPGLGNRSVTAQSESPRSDQCTEELRDVSDDRLSANAGTALNDANRQLERPTQALAWETEHSLRENAKFQKTTRNGRDRRNLSKILDATTTFSVIGLIFEYQNKRSKRNSEA